MKKDIGDDIKGRRMYFLLASMSTENYIFNVITEQKIYQIACG
jgi:hypothetical protein